tara:strand:- start:4790 stop:5890 length:1101 start_codon:yes stop_codon:yes gene_type:complete
MEIIQKIIDLNFLGNNGLNYLIFFISIFSGIVFKGLISRYLSHYFYQIIGKKETRVGPEKFKELLSKPIGYLIMLSFIYYGFNQLNFPEKWNLAPVNEIGTKMIILKSFSLIYIYSIFIIVKRCITFFGILLQKRAEESENKMDDQLVPFAIEIIRFISYILFFFVILGQVFNVNATGLITGLGIGGIAIAMASKESLENLLSSFTIFLDKPFTVGDIVTIGNVTGVVEKVGFRSTRIKTFDKSIVTVPNKKMVDAELDNLGLRPVRRVKFYVGLTYETSAKKIKEIVHDIQHLIDNHPKTNQEGKVRFQEFGASSLDILVLYYVNSPLWEDLIDVKEDINFNIMEIVNKHNSDFAFPSTTVYLQK